MTTVALAGASLVAAAGPVASSDTTQMRHLQEVQVTATRATATTPVAHTNVDKQLIEKLNHGLDLPFLLSTTPGVITTSDAGSGVGYTSLRVRGTDGTRINVTNNDIPMNEPESNVLYWVDTPDLASSLQDIQVQRGAGTSTNGAGAFGASINMRTQRFSAAPHAELNGSYGSFNTNKETLKVGSGLIKDHWNFDASLSHISSDGYRDRAWSKLYSYFFQGGYFGGQTSVRFISYGGKEETYHAWDGISKDQLKTDRTYNPNGEIKHYGKVTGFYKKQTDNFRQFNYQLIWDQGLGERWHWNMALHYTDNFGYYEEYKNARKLKEYGLTPFVVDDTEVKKSNLVRRKNNDGGFGGTVFSLNYSNDRLSATLGGGANYYKNKHYGNVIWVENYYGSALDPNHEYYRNTGKKLDMNYYIKANYQLAEGLSAYADLQYRHVGYKIKGENDKWDWTATPAHNQVLNVDEKFDFFNPKAGLYYKIDAHNNAYASFAVAHKEPVRNNYTDGSFKSKPKAERLLDYELGYQYKSACFEAGINLYYMQYHNQLVLNGKLNDIGEAMNENVKSSYRMGVELTAAWKPASWFRWDVNAALSRNKIKHYTGWVSDYDVDTWEDMHSQTAIEMGTTTISFSPSLVANNIFTFDYKGASAQLISQYVSRQYLDNMQNKYDSLDPYCVTHLDLAYTFKLPSVKSLTVGVTVYNLFNTKYETNGYSQTCALYKNGDKKTRYALSRDPRFYPMAGTNVLAHVSFKF